MNGIAETYDVAVIGGGPAGLAAAVAAHAEGASVCIVERENRLGGILKQCIHNGYGLLYFKEELTGPEYAARFIDIVHAKGIACHLETFLLGITPAQDSFVMEMVSSAAGAFRIAASTVVAATGCRERTAKQIFVHGTRPSGILTAGLAQYFVNVQGYLPGKTCVILGSGDIGLIMARRLTLEGARVVGVYEIKSRPSGLARNVVQCLEDYTIPLHLSKTVTAVHGAERIRGVTICSVDVNGRPLEESAEFVACDTLILSVGLIPENDILFDLAVDMDPATGGPVVDQDFMTSREGLFSCGNALIVSDLADYVSDAGIHAGRNAVYRLRERRAQPKFVELKRGAGVLVSVPQRIAAGFCGKVDVYFRSADVVENATVKISNGARAIFTKKYIVLKPPEMERVAIEIDNEFRPEDGLRIDIEGKTA